MKGLSFSIVAFILVEAEVYLMEKFRALAPTYAVPLERRRVRCDSRRGTLQLVLNH